VITPFGVVGAFHDTTSDSVVGERMMPPTLPGMPSRVNTVCVTENVLLPTDVSG